MTQTVVRLGLIALLALSAGCGTVQVEPHTQLPPPLVDQLPETVAVYYPAEFRDYVHKEQRYQVDYEIVLGPAHVTKLQGLLEAMFARVVEVDDPAKARDADPDVKLVLEPRFEDYAFLTPKDMVGESYTVTIRYRLNLYNPQGERVDGYVFTGYGREKAGGMSGSQPLAIATQRAMRDAGAKLAVELTSQESVRRLLAGEQVRPGPGEAEQVRDALGTFGTLPAAAPAPAAAGPTGQVPAAPDPAATPAPSPDSAGKSPDAVAPAAEQAAPPAPGTELP